MLKYLSAGALIGASLSWSSPSFAVTGNELLQQCTVERTDSTYWQMQGRCMGYIDGAVSSIVTYGAAAKNGICIPQGVTNGQLFDVTVNFLRTYPQIRHTDASQLMLGALASAFPCSAQRTYKERG